MSAAAAFFAPFAAGLRAPNRPAPPGLTTWNDSDPGVRFDVYRNNVVVSLVGALADGFPVTQSLVGEDFFLWMAREYILAEPPRSPVLAEYGDSFPAFIAGFEPAAGLAYLPDVARLERLRVRAYHAADAEAVSTALLTSQLQRPEQLPGTRLQLHPSLSLLSSSHAVVSIWAAHQGAAPPRALEVERQESALVLRSGDDVLILPTPPATAAFLSLLKTGATLGDATAAALESAPDFDLTQCLASLIRHGAIVAWQPPGDPAP
ncbi:DNA-binding domain-containing protein [Thiorhodococcus minor]|uniref:DUF2063 domain-containing protein n=1 Tax=Thiorhodococcus minor TaxID=57489 RepID=A0A6M0K1T9_9GAMM|nr:DNA-binding domain-containing protein [Thiorhodococcus minor]NEV63349.1 DUF2063 domain-containing protein [Thiorhodococcus minor]